ncbi:Ku protein [Pararhizobium sp. DWP1-1-3]|uniref:Ku protein n=1 Tax=Pararhizobium sp. DWP1-1-3 TaxID=2804652 RepID=UPI003CFA9AA4
MKGYERGEGEYIILEEEEIDAVALESVWTIEIQKFTPRESIDWIWLEKPHYLVPNDKVGEDAFAVIPRCHASRECCGNIASRIRPAGARGDARTTRRGHYPVDASLRR